MIYRSENIISPSMPDGRLIFVITFHEHLGVLLAPYLVHELSHGEFSLSCKRLNAATLPDHFPRCPENERQIVGILDECRDEELMRKFSKKATTPAEFFSELNGSRLKSLVIPYVQKRADKCLRIMSQAEIPLFFKGRKKDPVLSLPLVVQKEQAKAVFNFIRNDTESLYNLSLSHNGHEIPLNRPGSMIITATPGWILADGNIYLLEEGIEGNKVKPFFTREHVVIPRSSEEEYFAGFVANIIRNHTVRTTGIDLVIESPVCRPLLNLENDLAGNPVIALYFIYGEKKCRLTDLNRCWVNFTSRNGSYGFRKINRNTGHEKQYAGILTSKGLVSKDLNVFTLSSTDRSLYSLIGWMTMFSDELKDLGFMITQEFLKKKFHTGKITLDIGIKEINDWFDVYAYALFGSFRVPFIKLRNHLLNGKKEYALPDGQIAILPEEWFARYRDILTYGKFSGDCIRLGRHHFTIAENIGPKEGLNIDLFRLGDKKRLSLPSIPAELSGILRPYQSAGFAWMYFLYRHSLGGCLADDMGLGKTLQTLTLLWKLKNEHLPEPSTRVIANTPITQLELFPPRPCKNAEVRTSLIVMPLSLIHNWENEIRKFTPGLRYVKYTGTGREVIADTINRYDIVLTTYGIVRNDLDCLSKIGFFYLILDESQIIKNPGAKISRAVRKLNARHRLVLTGTPVENSLTDLWSQLSFLNPGLLGGQQFFQDEFVNPVEKFQDENKKNQLRKLIEPFILRRSIKKVEKDLPELSEKIYYCEMSEDQKNLYETRKSEIRNQILARLGPGGKGDMKIEVLRGLMQLRLIANHPLLTGNINKGSGKYEDVIRNIENLMAGGHKVLIFSQFVKHLRIYRDHFDSRQWKYSYLTGELKGHLRQEVISQFQDDPGNLLFLISLKAGGTGLNLTAADYVFILDPWWNPAVEKQAVSRAHRIGQKRNVMSYKYISAGTVEEKILKLQEKKSLLAGDFINFSNPLKLFTDEEILGLFD
jgi:superfamily II DNA or RNA helicase